MEKGTENKEKSQKSSFIWDFEKKRPSNFTILLLIIFTIIFLVSGVLGTLAQYHEIKLVTYSEGGCQGWLQYRDEDKYEVEDVLENLEYGSGQREFSYRIRVGIEISVTLSGFSDIMTLEIYDNGKMVAERTARPAKGNLVLSYTVGDN